MSLSGADTTPEFASRITYEAREDLAKETESQLPRAISTHDDDDDDEHRAALQRAHDEKESPAARDL